MFLITLLSVSGPKCYSEIHDDNKRFKTTYMYMYLHNIVTYSQSKEMLVLERFSNDLCSIEFLWVVLQYLIVPLEGVVEGGGGRARVEVWYVLIHRAIHSTQLRKNRDHNMVYLKADAHVQSIPLQGAALSLVQEYQTHDQSHPNQLERTLNWGYDEEQHVRINCAPLAWQSMIEMVIIVYSNSNAVVGASAHPCT